MIHEECLTCKYCAWCAKIKEKWVCECIRPKFWGMKDENGQKCGSYQKCSWEKNE